jgi:meckelin
MFILSYQQYGYYIHGRSVHGVADVGLREMSANFIKEEVNGLTVDVHGIHKISI